MPGPFPGMDPYLEDPALWPGVHDSLIVYIRECLQPLLRPRYFVDIRERIYFEDPRESLYPDAAVRPRRRPSPADPGGNLMVPTADEPIIFAVETRVRETYLEITARGSSEIITALEVISPANKTSAGHGRQEYAEKQADILSGRVSLVEIDLLRRGRPVVAAPPGDLRTLAPYDYVASVSRAWDRRHVEVYAVTVRQRLPRIAIPLREEDTDVVLDLPTAFARTYDSGDYLYRVEYDLPPPDPFRPEDGAWADELLRRAGLRDGGPPEAPGRSEEE